MQTTLTGASARPDEAPGATPRRFSVGGYLVLFALISIAAGASAVLLARQPIGYGTSLLVLLIGVSVLAARVRRPVGTARGILSLSVGFFAYGFAFIFALETMNPFLLRHRVAFPIGFALMLGLFAAWLVAPSAGLAVVARRRRQRAIDGLAAPDVTPFVIGSCLAAAFVVLWFVTVFAVLIASPPGTWQAVNSVVTMLALPAGFRPLWSHSYSSILARWEVTPPRALRERLDDLRDLARVEFDRVLCLRASFGNGNPCFVLPGSFRSTLVISEEIVRTLTPEQLLAVLTHEAAHVVMSHGNRALAWGGLGAAAYLALNIAGQMAISSFVPRSPMVVRIAVIVGPLAVLRQLYAARVTRRHEAEADEFATRLVGAPAMLGALEALRGSHAIEPRIHNRWTTHGTWETRVARIRTYGAGAADGRQ